MQTKVWNSSEMRGRFFGSKLISVVVICHCHSVTICPAGTLQLAEQPCDADTPYALLCTKLTLALTLAEVGDIRIYDGSLEQWAADPGAALQVAR